MLRKAKKWKPVCGMLSSQQQQISVKTTELWYAVCTTVAHSWRSGTDSLKLGGRWDK